MFVIVGLGNPGPKYENTHHNTGFRAIDELARRNNIQVLRTKCKALVGEGLIDGQKCVLCKPQTFMNLSGESVVQLKNWYKPEYDQLIVVYDDIDLPFGKIRFRPNGSAGTHNGMRNIVELTGSQDFPRVRIGVGRPPEHMDLADFVLSKPAENQIEEGKLAIEKAARTIEIYVSKGLEAARVFAGNK